MASGARSNVRPDLISAAWRGGTTIVRTIWKVTRQLFHEATGSLFALFALYSGVAAWRQFHQTSNWWIAGLALGYTLMMAFFSVSSFRSARRVR
ncbi:MAG TPA: hypothetical protein VGR81_02945 [Candidatus Acidoferrales bacterium]|nr:hypothetical protein [Candidatus Acidoferrales bacterium]